jgi:predicted Zn-dependent protease
MRKPQVLYSPIRQDLNVEGAAATARAAGRRTGLSTDAGSSRQQHRNTIHSSARNKLVATIPQEYSWPFEFHVVPQKEINAFALPGGQMFINIGTVSAAKNESELAGVMAHEMSHVYMQHSAKQAAKAQKTELLAGIASAVLGSRGGIVGQVGQMGIQMGAQGLMMKYSRSDDRRQTQSAR